MDPNLEKKSLRRLLLEKREATSHEMIKIASERIRRNLKKIEVFESAKKIAAYYPLGNEVRTQDIIQEALSYGKEISLPRVSGKEIQFRKIEDFSSLEKGMFDIMEPKENCPISKELDVVLVPAVGMSSDGARLGYGHGYYDRYLLKNKVPSIALIFEKQIIKKIPRDENDAVIDWIVTEDRVRRSWQ